MPKTPTTLAGTSPKYDNENFVCGFSLPLVGFGGGRRGSGVVARVESLRGRNSAFEPREAGSIKVFPYERVIRTFERTRGL